MMPMKNIFCPRKARKYSYSGPDSIDTKMTLALECRLRLPWQAKLALPSLPASPVGRNKLIRASARISVSGKHPSLPETLPRTTRPSASLRRALDGLIPTYFAATHGLVPKLQLGNPVREALASRTEQEARASKTAFPSWNLGTSVTK